MCYRQVRLMWTNTHFPAAMRSLNLSTRAKAIEIANQLMAQGHSDKQLIVSTSINEARRWARNSQMIAESSVPDTRLYA